MRSPIFVSLLLAASLLAAALRFPYLGHRPMHCDEAVHGDKLGTLLESGRYVYDPSDYHGPALYYLTALYARFQGAARYVDVDEVMLRSVPAFFGIGLVAAHALLAPFIGRGAAVAAAFLAAISPAMVFYGRYYIHEVLLVFFTFVTLVSAVRYLRRPNTLWAAAAGASAGLMIATKETAAIALGSMLAAASAAFFARRAGSGPDKPIAARVRGTHLLVSVLSAFSVWLLLFSSFFTNSRGLADSVRAIWIQFNRTGAASPHAHPWHYYLGLLLYFPAQGTPFWTEGVIAGLGLAGGVAGWSTRGVPGTDGRLLRYLGIYTVIMMAVYAAIPYKTPWCLLGFLHGLVLLAGAGVVYLWHAARSPARRAALLLVVLAGVSHLAWQAWAGSFRFDSDPRNPYVYGHTGRDVFLIAQRFEELALAAPEGKATPIDIVSRENLWPLPWYFRRLTGLRWWSGVSETEPNAPLILVSPDMEDALVRKLYELPPPGERELFMNVFERRVELRPHVELRGYAAKSLWDAYLNR